VSESRIVGYIGVISGVATAVGVYFAAIQLRLSQQNETARRRAWMEIKAKLPATQFEGLRALEAGEV
jgi:hypothetical protein